MTGELSMKLRFADVAVTPTAKEFDGIYRGKKQHDNDFDAVLDRAETAGVEKVMLTGMSLNDVDYNLALCRKRPQICTMTVGVHPYHAMEPWEKCSDGPSEYLDILKKRVHDLLQEGNTPLKAFGELGLDYDRIGQASKETQIKTFKAQLDMITAAKWDLPLFLHCRNSCADFISILEPYLPHLPRGGLVHSFVGSTEELQSVLSLSPNLHVSVNGFSFMDKGHLDMVAAIPLNRLQIETDAPWGYINPNGELAKKYPSPVALPPSKKKDKFELGLMVKERNESCAIGQVASIVAGLKCITVEEVVEASWSNSTTMFNLQD